MDRFGHNMMLALAAYNAAKRRRSKRRTDTAVSETMAYVPKVLKIYRMLTEQPRAT